MTLYSHSVKDADNHIHVVAASLIVGSETSRGWSAFHKSVRDHITKFNDLPRVYVMYVGC